MGNISFSHQSRQCPLAAAAQASQNSLNCRNPIISCQLDHYFCSNNILHRLHSNTGEWNMKCDQFLFVLCCEWLVSFLVEIFATFVRAAGGDTSWFARPPLTILLRCTSWPELTHHLRCLRNYAVILTKFGEGSYATYQHLCLIYKHFHTYKNLLIYFFLTLIIWWSFEYSFDTLLEIRRGENPRSQNRPCKTTGKLGLSYCMDDVIL